MGHTAAMLNKGTQMPMSTEISSKPGAPAKRSAMAKPMKELNLKAICALAAWSRLEKWCFKPGKNGKA
jgi:hypothetical protein